MDNKSLVNRLNSLFPDLNFTVEKLKNINQTIMLDLCKKIIIYLYETDSKNVAWKVSFINLMITRGFVINSIKLDLNPN